MKIDLLSFAYGISVTVTAGVLGVIIRSVIFYIREKKRAKRLICAAIQTIAKHQTEQNHLEKQAEGSEKST